MIAYSNHDKDLLLNNTARVYSRLTFTRDGETIYVANEDDSLQEWDYEDYRYVPENGFIGQFVERLLDGKLLNLPSAININGCEVQMEIGIKDPDEDTVNYYNYGHFLITKVSDTDTNGTVSFESSDYVKKFNKKYEDRIAYPCLACHLLQDVCEQAGVETAGSASDTLLYYIPDSDGTLPIGTYSFKNGQRYINFTTTIELGHLGCLMLWVIDGTPSIMFQCIIEEDGTRTMTTLSITNTVSSTGTLLTTQTCIYNNSFENYNFVIENNQFEENTTLRDVVKNIAALGFTWARVGCDDKLYLDFTKSNSFDYVGKYRTINTDTYYTSSKNGDKFGPVSEVLVGMSNVEGENIVLQEGNRVLASENSREVSPEQDDEHNLILLDSPSDSLTSISIYDNPLTYTEELRTIAIKNGGSRLLGLEYTPMASETIGYPWLDGDDFIKIENVDNETYYTYPFNRHISYKGYLESSIDSIAKNLTQTEYKYEGDVDRRIKHTEIIVDKHEGEIRLINENVNNVENNLSELEGQYSDVLSQIDIANTNITQLSSRVDTVQTSTYTKTQIQQIVDGTGVDGVKVTAVSTTEGKFDKDGMHYSKTNAPTSSTINELGLEVDAVDGDEVLLYAGYDNDNTSTTYGQSIVKTANLTVSNWTVVGKHGRFEVFDDGTNPEGVGFFLV